MEGLVAYKPTPTPPQQTSFPGYLFAPRPNWLPRLHQYINKHLWNFTFFKSQTNKVSVALEPWRFEGWSSQELIISTLFAGGERVGRIWEVRVSTSKNIGWFDMKLPYYYHYYYIIIFMEIFYFILKIRKNSVLVYDYRFVVHFVI